MSVQRLTAGQPRIEALLRHQIGVAAPILVVILRVIQGLAVGGEWAGATLLAAENAPKAKRGFYAMFPQFGPAIAFSLASATFLATALLMSAPGATSIL